MTNAPEDEKVVEAVAKALWDADRKRELEAIAEVGFDTSLFETAGAMLSDANRRETVIVGWALTSYCLDFGMRQHLRYGSKNDLKDLIEGLGPLASDAAKLKLGKALGWIGTPLFDAANAVRKLRNRVAHQIVRNDDVEGYASIPEDARSHLEGVLGTMRTYVETKSGVKIDAIPIDDDIRMKCAMILLAGSVLSAVVFGPGRLRLGVKEGTLFFDADDGPKWWRDAATASAKATIVIVRSGLLAD